MTSNLMPDPGHKIMSLMTRSTVGLTVLLLAAAAIPGTLAGLAAVVSLAMFALGAGLLAYALIVGAQRSRSEVVTVSGLFGLQGCAPARVRRVLLGAVAVQFVVAMLAAGIRIYSMVAFGILAPTFGLGLVAVWAARHGTFPPRVGAPLWQDGEEDAAEEDG